MVVYIGKIVFSYHSWNSESGTEHLTIAKDLVKSEAVSWDL
jgi:hypothetical protein